MASKDENVWDLLQELITQFVTDMMFSGEKVEELGQAWDKVGAIFTDTINLNMDKKQAMINIINTICKAM
jgi:hypothetical protein